MKFAPHFEKYRNRDLSIIKVDYDSIQVSDPPKDLSHTTTMELDEVGDIVEGAKLPKSLVKVADEDPVRLFTSVAKKNKLDPLESEARVISEDWNTIAFYFKDKFKRRRPYEILKEHDKDFPFNRTSSSESPSYPSGHSMQGYGLAEFYKVKYPYLSDEWDNIADILAHSRLQLGVHFPSDNKASKSIVAQVVSQQKTAADNHVETRRKQRAKYLDPKDLKKIESRVRKTKDLPDGANYITLPHGRKAVVRTDGGKSHLATILGPAMRPPGKDVSSLLIKASGFSKDQFLKEARAQIIRRINRITKMRNATANKPRRRAKLKPTAQSPVATQPTTTNTTTGMPNKPGFLGGMKTINPAIPIVGVGGAGLGATQLHKRSKPYQPNKFKSGYNPMVKGGQLGKTSSLSEQPLLRHRSTLLIRDPETGKLLAANNREDRNFSDVSPFYFPGGGLYDDEYGTPRTPTEEEILEGARREALEELGMTLNNPRVVSSTPHLLTQKAWRDKVLRRRGVPYEGGHEHLVLADKGDVDNSLYNVEGDAFTKGDYYDPQEVYDSLYGYGQQGGQFSAYNVEQAKAIKEHLLTKTAEEQPLLRHRSTLLIRDPETNKLLAAKEPANSKASPFFFPGGGLYDDEYDTPRNPSDEDIIEGARREALEELGIELDNPRVVGTYGQELEDWWKEKTLKNRGVPYLGGHEHYVLADRGKEDRSLYNIEGDAFEQGDYYDPKEIVEALSRVAKGDSTFAPFNREQVRVIKDNLLNKQANDLSVLTAVPRQNLDLIMRKGLASQKAISEDPEMTEAFLRQRGLKEEGWRKELSEALKGHKPASRLGPSVFFSEPDPVKVSDPRHFINQFDTTALRVNLGKLLKDIPETRFHGVELEPFNEEAWEADPDNYPSRRHRDLTTDEIAALIAKDPKELWKDYKDEYIGKYYAADVPHAQIVTPSGIIPPEYLEQVEKTSEAKTLYHGSRLDLDELVPQQARGSRRSTDEHKQKAVYLTEDPKEALIYALMSRPDVGNYFIQDNVAYYPDERPVNEKGYVYKVNVDDYDKPTDAKAGIAYKDSIKPVSREEVAFKDNLERLIALPKEEWIARHRGTAEKTSSAKEQLKHILVTGHSGAGKSTYAKELAEELGIPLHRLDVTTGPIMEAEYPEYWDKGTLGYPEDVSTRVIQEALALDTPHVIEGSHILEIPELTEGYKRVLIDTPEDRVVEQRAQREYRNQGRKGKPYRPIEKHREAAKELVDHYRSIVTDFRNQPGVESIIPEVKQASLEAQFQPDLTPDDLKALGVYDQVYGDAPSEASMKEWPEHWINKQDPLGWLQWYERYSKGRRTDDDARQIKRWKSFKARHLAQYLKNPTIKRKAALRNWAIETDKD